LKGSALKKGTKKIIIFIALIAVIWLLNRHFGWSKSFSGSDWLGQMHAMVQTNFAKAVIIYIAFTVVACVLLALPGVTFAIIAGAVFGPWWGTLFCTLAATIGAILAFLVGRFFLQEGLRDKVMKNNYIRKLLFSGNSGNEMMVLMVTRLVPVFPYNLQNFAYGITDISLAKYSIGSFIFMIPGTAMYTFGTSAIASGEDRALYIVLTVVIAAAVIFISRKLQKKYVPKEDAEGEKADD
jgi:uncharacterized membrane protein YdjX (TVP38/TMEM64 family)